MDGQKLDKESTSLINPVLMAKQLDTLRDVMGRLRSSYGMAVLVKQRLRGVLEVSRRVQVNHSATLHPIIANKLTHLSK